MIRRSISGVGAVLFVVALLGACGSASGSGDCTVQCNDTETQCVKACNDDTCKSKCTTDFDNCTASCSAHVTVDGG